MKFFILCACALFFVGCAADRYDVNLYGVDYQDDAEVVLGELVEAVTPLSMPDTEFRALILPFALRQEVAVRRDVGREMADIFRRSWLEKRVFGTMEYDPSLVWPGLDHALALARARGANILVSGNVSQFYEGGATGRTIHRRHRGGPLGARRNPCLVGCAGGGHGERSDQGLRGCAQRAVRLPEHPTYAVMRALSRNMAAGLMRHLPRKP